MRAINSLVAVAVLAAAGVFAPIRPATATPITYTFSSDASILVAGDTESITGGFTYDPATSTQSDVSITLTGPFIQSIPTTFSDTGPSYISPSNNQIQAYTDCVDTQCLWIVDLYFTGPLTTAADPLGSAGLYFYNVPTTFPDLSVTGSVIPAGSPIPEPSGVVLLSMAFGVLSLACRLGQRARRA